MVIIYNYYDDDNDDVIEYKDNGSYNIAIIIVIKAKIKTDDEGYKYSNLMNNHLSISIICG